jgi:AraC family transcriptional regulator
VRLETAARKLLFNPDADITGLAFELGFSSSQNFAKAFRKHFDMSPTEFRQQASAGNPEHRTNGNIDRTAGNACGDDDSYDPGHVLIGTRTEDIAIHVEVRDLPALRVAYRRHFGSYNDPGVQQAFDELRRWAEPRGLYDPENCLGIPWDDHDITPEEHCRFDACQIVDAEDRVDAGVGQQTIPAGRYAVYCCEVVQDDFDSPWTDLMQNWLPISGYQPADGPRFERYLTDGSQDADGRWQIEICLPVRPL